ncbi:ATP-binding protein [Streptomyces sp. NPDC047880]|uniref:ATP-binding protein n=1 Tax=Streptomyces sp. NPDC047880 TaxID=3155626 RepID=UPI0034520BD9
MKQSAAKSLGVAALGAAFAVSGAGAANAALPATAQTLETVTTALPAEQLSQTVPGSGEALGQGQAAVGAGHAAAQPAAEQILAGGPTGPDAKLLGGLPVQGLPTQGLPTQGLPTQGLSTQGLPVNGVPVG